MKKHLRFIFHVLFFSTVPLITQAQCANFPVVNIGADTALCDTVLFLDAGNAGMNFLWSTAETTQQIAANSGGAYSVTVTDSLGCSASDTINLVFNPPSVAGIISLAGGDTILCGNEPTLFYSTGHTGYVLWWVMDTINWVWAPFGSGDTLDYGPSPNNMSGVYTIMATATNGNCPADTTNMLNIALHTSPEVDLGPDSSLCGGGLVIFSGYPGEQTLWSTGDTTNAITIIGSGIYTCTITFQNGCADTDTVTYTVFPWPTVSYSCPVDTICVGDGPLLLVPGIPVGGSFVGTNVAGGYFNPVTGGSNLVVYSWTDTITGCTGGAGDYIWVDTCLGVLEVSLFPTVNVYPNPATGYITIALMKSDETIEIHDALGRIVHSVRNSRSGETIQIDISGLDEGIYFVRVDGSSGTAWSSFLKQSE